MQITLRIGHLDTMRAERGVDGEIKIAQYLHAVVDVDDEAAQIPDSVRFRRKT